MTREYLINKYALDVSVNTLQRLDEITRLENIENDWNPEKYISFDTITKDYYQINFWGQSENILFNRVNNTNYFRIDKKSPEVFL